MTDKHALILDHQVAQSRKVKVLMEENARLLALAEQFAKDLDIGPTKLLALELRNRLEALRGGVGE